MEQCLVFASLRALTGCSSAIAQYFSRGDMTHATPSALLSLIHFHNTAELSF